FVNTDASEQHYVRAGRIATIGLFVCASGMVYLLDTAKDAFDVILQVGAGTGLLYLVRWFWWRVTAWCEIVAMISSFLTSVVLLILAKNGVSFSTHVALIATVAVTTVCWLLTAYLGPQTDKAVLVRFYTLVKPFGPGWAPVKRDARLPAAEARATHENIPMALIG